MTDSGCHHKFLHTGKKTATLDTQRRRNEYRSLLFSLQQLHLLL
jgi:hypothetical protein